MTDPRTTEQIAVDVDEKLDGLSAEAQTATAIYAQGVMAGMALQKGA
jgi:hypothetical protein